MSSRLAGNLLAPIKMVEALVHNVAALARDVASQGITVITFSPGWVRTDMGGPEASLGAEESIGKLRKLIEEQSIENSGTFLDYTGEIIPY